MRMERKKRKTKLPRTSRVNDRIIEYYKKFGQGRDLEKFMRLYSPGGSQRSCLSTTTTTSLGSSISDDHICRNRLSKSHKDVAFCQLTVSKSLPNMERSDKGDGDESEAEEMVIPIEMTENTENADKNSESASAEEINTPKSAIPMKTKHTQTPESVVKCHKRLEWDSLGDVGYFKSMSTSNISLLERTLLKDLFDDQMITSDSDKLMGQTHIQIKKTVKKLQEKKNMERSGQLKAKVGPLASSTLLEPNVIQKQAQPIKSAEIKPKKTEKCVQTSLRNVGKANQEVQVSFSSATPSAAGSLTTPTSFSYYSSHSSRSTANSKKPSRKSSQTDTDNSYIKSISDMLAQRRKTAEAVAASVPVVPEISKKNSQEDEQLQQMHDTLSEVLDEDKENASFLYSPQMDLGIKLICSLIEARTVNPKQRKHLVREIVKRISRIESCKAASTDSNKPTSSSSSRTNSDCETARKVVESLTYRSHRRLPNDGNTEDSHRRRQKPLEAMTQHDEEQLRTKSMPIVSDDVVNNLEKQMKDIRSELLDPIDSGVSVRTHRTAEKLAALADKIKAYEEIVSKAPKVPIRTTSRSETRNEAKIKNSHASVTLDRQQTTKAKPVATKADSSVSANSSSTTSRNVVTLLPARMINETPTDEELTARREWYNPLTQSEIEYEEKRRTMESKSKKSLKKQEKQQLSSERFVQLNWIDSELERLEGLRKLLLQQDDATSTDAIAGDTGKKTKITKSKHRDDSEKIYDTVYTAPSSTDNMSGIELRIEDSLEATISKAGQKKHTRERIVVTTTFDRDGSKRTSCCRSEKNLNKIELPKPISAPKVERSKMETPVSNSDNTVSTEDSVRSFAEQRKREFLEHYKHKKQEHYADIEKRKEKAKEQHDKFRARTASPTVGQPNTESHYSIPHTMPRVCPLHCFNPCYHQPYIFPLPPPLPPQPSQKPSKQDWSSTDRNTSSSVFCMSSEVSIPMGSNPTSSTTTTTHQYDDVNGEKYVRFVRTGTSCQTGPSLLGCNHSPNGNSECSCKAKSSKKSQKEDKPVEVETTPKKGVAYVITFIKKKPDETKEKDSEKIKEEPIKKELAKGEPPSNAKKTEKQEETVTTTGEIKPQAPLEDILRNAYPRFVARVKSREAILREMQLRRQKREREMREIVENTSLSSLEGKLQRLPPPPTQQIRVFQTDEMKAITKKKVSKLTEVVKKKERDNQDRIRRGNRVMKNVFNQRLQKRVRNGQLSLNHSKTLI